jgi:hypothetical protein
MPETLQFTIYSNTERHTVTTIDASTEQYEYQCVPLDPGMPTHEPVKYTSVESAKKWIELLKARYK